MSKQVFMVGERRSGTNLLRLMLNQHPQIVAPHMAAILDKLVPLTSCYDHLELAARKLQMVDDALRVMEFVPVEWRGPQLSREQIASLMGEASFFSFIGALMRICADGEEAQVWVNKEPNALRWHSELSSELGEVLYLYLYRDPRDVVASFARLASGDKHPYVIAQEWVRKQELGLEALRLLGPSRVHLVAYEQLVENPRTILEGICSFLQIPFSPVMLEHHRHEEAQRVARYGDHWGSLDRPVTTENRRKYRKKLTEDDISVVESVAGQVMDRLGYERDYIQTGEEIRFSSAQVQVFERENEELKSGAMAQVEQGRWKHIRQLQEFLLHIESRGGAKVASPPN